MHELHSKQPAASLTDEPDYESLPEYLPAHIHMTAGALAGILEHTITYPFDFVKTRMQVLRPHQNAVYSGVMDAFRRISTGEGLRSLYGGVQSVVLGAGPAHAVYFATYEQAKRMLLGPQRTANEHPERIGLAGALATAASDAFMTPFDVIKQRLQVHATPYRTFLSCVAGIYRAEGLGGFYVSYPTTLLLNVPFHMIQFPVYETCRSLLTTRRRSAGDGEEEVYNPLTHIISGSVSGGTAAFLTTPIDVVKTTLQTRNLLEHPLRGMADAASLIHREHGLKGFFRGAVPRMLTFVPATAACWSVYEYFKWFLAP